MAPVRLAFCCLLNLGLVVGSGACAGKAPARTVSPAAESTEPRAQGPERGGAGGAVSASVGDPNEDLKRAERALAKEEPARAVALFSRAVSALDSGPTRRSALLGLARAHEQLRDCDAALRAYERYLAEKDILEPERAQAFARRGACEAELERWEASAASYARALELVGSQSLPSLQVELLARQGYALVNLERFDDAETVLRRSDEIYERAQQQGTERFATYYFAGMTRFYRAALLHLKFRAQPIRLPEARMTKDFARKLELLQQAQAAYNKTIEVRHVFWVSASGYQLGSLFEEFYDALMYAPVPEWLDDKQKRVYYDELKKQLRPIVTKAVWVFEKNLETARRLGYENRFIDETEDQLARLQGILLAEDERLGQPTPQLLPRERSAPEPETANSADLPALERKLFIPAMTSL